MITTQFLQKKLTFLQLLKIAELVSTHFNNVGNLTFQFRNRVLLCGCEAAYPAGKVG